MVLKTELRPRWWLYPVLLVLVAGLCVSLLAWVRSSRDASVSRTGYIAISGGVKLAYDLTLPAA